MGKATGFMDYDRQDKMAEDPKERIKHFKEFHTPLSKEEQELQGARCLSLIHICTYDGGYGPAGTPGKRNFMQELIPERFQGKETLPDHSR